GVIHAAGVTNDQLVTSMTDDAVREVVWSKIGGSQVLHDAFPPGSVDFFFLTSSAATVFGIPGQGSYAAANAYLDALARSR
ncbi:KR domain-containing protein, partial [Acinetobacter baumannii]